MSTDYCPGGGATVDVDRVRKVRCGVCNRRLTAKSKLHGEGTSQPEFEGYAIPQHKARVKAEKKPRREARNAIRARGRR